MLLGQIRLLSSSGMLVSHILDSLTLPLSSSSSSPPPPQTHLHVEVVHGVHGEGLDDLEVLEDGLPSGQTRHHAVVLEDIGLTG